MAKNQETVSLIVRHLEQHGSCTLETLVLRISPCTWNQVFAAIDELSREGTITLEPYHRFDYTLSLARPHPQAPHHPNPSLGASEVLTSCGKPCTE